MATLRDGIEKAQFQTPPSTELLSVAAKFGLKPPVSLLRVAQLLKPETLDWDTGWITPSGGHHLVQARGRLRLVSTGSWTFKGEVQDLGDGATFAFVVTPKFVDQSGKALLFGEADELSSDETTSFSKEGRDLWIARNWDAVRSAGFHYSMHASATTGVGEVIAIVVSAGLAAIAIYGAAKCTDEGTWTKETRPDGSTAAVCHMN